MSRRLVAFLTIVGITLAVTLIWGLWYFFSEPKSPQPLPVTPPSVATQQITPTNLQEIRRKFGSWTRTTPGQTGSPHLVMLLQSGAVDESSKTVQIDSDWKQAQPFQVVNFEEAHHQVRLSTNDSRIYEVSYDQAFILEQSPGDTYAFRHDGSSGTVLVTIPTDRLSR
jgi:hypothetical protein